MSAMGPSPSVLVVEDHPRVAKSICRGLPSQGYVVRIAATGDEGRALMRREAFDLVVLDPMLPGSSMFTSDGFGARSIDRDLGGSCV
jgi:DNA-binding response OmpR family regulator